MATTVVAMALGQELRDRNPSIEWMRLLIDRVDGPLDRRESKDDVAQASPEEADNVLSAEVAERMLAGQRGRRRRHGGRVSELRTASIGQHLEEGLNPTFTS